MGYLQGGDFDIEDRVSGQEGERIVSGVAFGNYDSEVYGEVESYDVLTIGDFDDADLGMGRSRGGMTKIAKKSFTAVPKKLPVKRSSLPINTGIPNIASKKYLGVPAPHRGIQSGVPSINKSSVVSQGKRLGWGKKSPIKSAVPSAASLSAKAKQIVRAKVTQAKNTMAANVLKKGGGVQSVSAVAPRAKAPGVVSTSGTTLTASDLATPVSEILRQSVNPYAHPLAPSTFGAEYDLALGEYEAAMGLDFKALMSKAKTQLKTAVKTGTQQLLTSGKTIFGEKLSAAGGKILAQPEVKALAVQQADIAATNKLAEMLRDPEYRKKAIAVGSAIAVVALGLYMKKQTGKFLGVI